MANLWQAAVGLDFSESDLRKSSLTPRRHSQSSVPIGTVASRILDFQNLAQISMSGRGLPSPVRHEEQFKNEFEWRPIARFGQLASLSTNPDEKPQTIDGHSFSGLSSPYANHVKEHALVDGRSRWERTARIRAHIQPSGLDKRIQCGAVSPWTYLPSSKPYRKIKSSSDQDGEKSADSYTSTMPSIKPILNSTSQDISAYDNTDQKRDSPKACQERMLGGRKGHIALSKQHAGGSDEWKHAETKHSMQRQSMGDLYHSQRIKRPVGFLSHMDFAFDPLEAPRPEETHASRKVCRCVSDERSTYCSCGHLLHAIPEIHSFVPKVGEDNNVHSKQKLTQPRCQNLYNYNVIEKNHELKIQKQLSPGLQEQREIAAKEGEEMQENLIESPPKLKYQITSRFNEPHTLHKEDSLCRTYQKTSLNDKDSSYTYPSSQKPTPPLENLNSISQNRKIQQQHNDTDSECMGGVSHHNEFDHIEIPRGPRSGPQNLEHDDDGYENDNNLKSQRCIIHSLVGAPHDEGQMTSASQKTNYKIRQDDHIVAPTLSPTATSHSCQTLAVIGIKETVATTTEGPIEHTPNPQYQHANREGMRMDRKLARTDAALQTFKQLEKDHECPCNQSSIVATASNMQVQGQEKREIHDVGIKGITILIHLEGGKDVVLEADLNLGF